MKVLGKNKMELAKSVMSGEKFDSSVLFNNVADHVINFAEFDLHLSDIFEKTIINNRHTDAMPVDLFFYGLLSSKMKQLFSVSDSVVSITSIPLMNLYSLNVTKKEFTTESNMRKFITSISKTGEVTDVEISKEIEKIEELNKNKKKDKQKSIDKAQIKKDLQIKKNGHTFIDIFNNIMKYLIPKITTSTEKEEGSIYILDCVKIPVNIKNDNYELSSVINYEGKPTRGYKLGALRMVTEFGGVISKLIDGTITDNDLKLVEDEIIDFESFKENDYLIMDRGFLKIDFIKKLVNKKINVFVPLKKNMEAYDECIKQAKLASENEWTKHPNPKRKGQDILLLNNLKGTWLSDSEKTKKPSNYMKTALDFSACVIRIDKTIKENKKIIASEKKAECEENETDILYEDNKYIYIVIASTNTNLSASQIVRYYEMRPEIEEDFRQLKDIWKMCSITSTKYNFIMCHLTLTILAYNLFVIYKHSDKGKKYINKSIRTISKEEKRNVYAMNEVHYLLMNENYYYVYDTFELIELFSQCESEIREKIRDIAIF